MKKDNGRRFGFLWKRRGRHRRLSPDTLSTNVRPFRDPPPTAQPMTMARQDRLTIHLGLDVTGYELAHDARATQADVIGRAARIVAAQLDAVTIEESSLRWRDSAPVEAQRASTVR